MEKPALVCEVCNASVAELRRGRCWGCYSRWVEARPVGVGARCVTCPEKRRRFLKTVELFGNWKPMCFNCAGVVTALERMPQTIAQLRDAMSRDRRRKDRRWGKVEGRVFVYERRVGERRTSSRDEYPSIEDEMIIEVTIEAADVATEADHGDQDLTQIREMVRDLRPRELRLT